MTRAEIDARIEVLRPLTEEFEHLQMCAHMLDEGIMKIDSDGGLYAVADPEVLPL